MSRATGRQAGPWGLILIAALAMSAAVAMPAGGAEAGDRIAARVLYDEGVDRQPKLGYRPQIGMFLLATPRLSDPRFSRTVVLLLNYDETGALGVVVNRPTDLSLRDALAVPLPGSETHLVHYGGPVEPQRLVALHRSSDAVGDEKHLFGDVYASASIDTLRRLLKAVGHAKDVRTYAGYAGWSPGQLDAELARGDWIVTPADDASIFDASPEEVWHDLMRRNSGRWVRRARPHSA